jgi:putative SOS response-associated peptidase YedK
MRPVHAKAMPVILTAETWDTWLQGDEPAALVLQRPAPDGLLSIVATGQREDGAQPLLI